MKIFKQSTQIFFFFNIILVSSLLFTRITFQKKWKVGKWMTLPNLMGIHLRFVEIFQSELQTSTSRCHRMKSRKYLSRIHLLGNMNIKLIHNFMTIHSVVVETVIVVQLWDLIDVDFAVNTWSNSWKIQSAPNI